MPMRDRSRAGGARSVFLAFTLVLPLALFTDDAVMRPYRERFDVSSSLVPPLLWSRRSPRVAGWSPISNGRASSASLVQAPTEALTVPRPGRWREQPSTTWHDPERQQRPAREGGHER